MDAYILTLRIEELSRRLRNGDYIPATSDRSPSPEPIFGPGGVRINTPEVRYKQRLEAERNRLTEEGLKAIPAFKPPPDYKRQKLSEKIYIPARDFPEINFIGLLIGPRGYVFDPLS